MFLQSIMSSKNYQLLLITWSLLFVAICMNCTVHEILIEKERINLFSSISWSLKEYGVWFLVMPALSFALGTKKAMNNATYLAIVGLYTLTLVFTINALIDVTFDNIRWQESVFLNWHKHALAYLAVIGILWLKQYLSNDASMMKEQSMTKSQSIAEDQAITEKQAATAKQFAARQKEQELSARAELVINEITFYIDEIYFVKAAGNYVEVMTKDGLQLVRATLKQVLVQIKEYELIQCHRSYLVNLSYAEKLENERAGHGILNLTDGHLVPVSKAKRCFIRSRMSNPI